MNPLFEDGGLSTGIGKLQVLDYDAQRAMQYTTPHHRLLFIDALFLTAQCARNSPGFTACLTTIDWQPICRCAPPLCLQTGSNGQFNSLVRLHNRQNVSNRAMQAATRDISQTCDRLRVTDAVRNAALEIYKKARRCPCLCPRQLTITNCMYVCMTPLASPPPLPRVRTGARCQSTAWANAACGVPSLPLCGCKAGKGQPHLQGDLCSHA